MDVKGKIEEIVNRAKNDEGFHQQLKENPIKAVEDLLGLDLPGEQVRAIAEGVKTKLNLDNATVYMENIGGKVEELFHKKS